MDKKTAVFTTKRIVASLEPITLIVHDNEGEWQFLGDSQASMEDLMMVSLQQILDIDSTVEDALSISHGQEAHRLADGNWKKITSS